DFAKPFGSYTRTMTSPNVSAVRAVYEEGWNRGDLSVLDRYLSPDYIDHEAPPEISRGIESAKRLFRMYDTIFKGARFHLEEIVDGGEWVTARVRVEAVHAGEFFGQPPSGKSV